MKNICGFLGKMVVPVDYPFVVPPRPVSWTDPFVESIAMEGIEFYEGELEFYDIDLDKLRSDQDPIR